MRGVHVAVFSCSICGKQVEYGGALPADYPFCSARCRWVDLGHWLSEQYSIERELTPEENAGADAPRRPDPARD